MSKVILAIPALLLSINAQAYFIWGTGKDLCSDFIGAKAEFEHRGAEKDHLAHVNWVKGFITGINWAKDSEIARDLDIETVRKWMDNYCRANLHETVAAAAAAMVTELEAQE